jgi:hypothetical protein
MGTRRQRPPDFSRAILLTHLLTPVLDEHGLTWSERRPESVVQQVSERSWTAGDGVRLVRDESLSAPWDSAERTGGVRDDRRGGAAHGRGALGRMRPELRPETIKGAPPSESAPGQVLFVPSRLSESNRRPVHYEPNEHRPQASTSIR